MPFVAKQLTPIEALEIKKKAEKCFDLYLSGASYRKIAEAVGISHTQVGNYVRTMLETAKKDRPQDFESMLEIDLARLDGVIEAFYSNAQAGCPVAAAIIMKCLERRAKYLGLDAPEKREVSGTVTLTQLLEKTIAQEPESEI